MVRARYDRRRLPIILSRVPMGQRSALDLRLRGRQIGRLGSIMSPWLVRGYMWLCRVRSSA